MDSYSLDEPIGAAEIIGEIAAEGGAKAAERDNAQDPLIARLTADAATRGEALEELRVYLTRGLAKSIASRCNAILQPEDVVQDALLKILDSLDQFAGRSRFTTWAMTVAVRIAISQMRLQSKFVELNKSQPERALPIQKDLKFRPKTGLDLEHSIKLWAFVRALVRFVVAVAEHPQATDQQ